ncbi:MAG: Nickel-dependent hydrogenase large subunit [Parcubacteria group bacterium LiPW_39]|nr:MAG: Nickel-dependent hydrogenase large subunit [Parcubacteria group bacterium LiPW_39]
MQIKIDHIAKIEGHAGFTADIADGKVSKARLDVMEGARLLEGILRGRSINEVSQITARICGICPVVHNLTSLKALEKALEIEISEQTLLLRKLMLMGQIINSHALHLFFFSLSDFFGIKDDLTLIKKYPGRAKDALAIRDFGNKINEVIGGRSIHPLTPTIGGFTKLPDKCKLGTLFHQTEKVLKNAKNLTSFFLKLKYPDFVRSAPYASLAHDKEYAFCEGLIKTSANRQENPADFINIIKEYQLQNSAVKRAEYLGKPYMVGAISRLNNNAGQLNQEAKKWLKAAKIQLPSFNPFHNILAQAIEIIHCVEESEKLLKKILRQDLKLRDVAQPEHLIQARFKKIKDSLKGTAAMEAPRGTLYYFYEIGGDGLVKNCNIITPTSQNLARLEKDLEEYLPQIVGKNATKKDYEDKIKMLVRAYDPCLTCATH